MPAAARGPERRGRHRRRGPRRRRVEADDVFGSFDAAGEPRAVLLDCGERSACGSRGRRPASACGPSRPLRTASARPLERRVLESSSSSPPAGGPRSAPRSRSRSRAAARSARRGAGGTRPSRRRPTRSGACRSTAAPCGRSPGASASSGMQSMCSGALTRNRSRPPGRSSRAASGIQRAGRTRCSRRTRRSRSRSSRRGTARARRCRAGARTRRRARACSPRAVSSCACELSMPTGRAPRRASHAETYAVPQPSSIASRPSRSSGQHPQLRLGHAPDAPRRLRRSPLPCGPSPRTRRPTRPTARGCGERGRAARSSRIGQQQLDVAVLRAALGAVLDADLRVVVGELAAERGERRARSRAAGVPGRGVASVAAWSMSVPKIDSVPSRLSMISSSRDWIGQSISDDVSIPQNPPPPSRLNGVMRCSCVWPATYATTCGCASSSACRSGAEVQRLRAARVEVAARARSTARSAQSPASSSTARFVRLPIGWWPKTTTSSSRASAAFSSRSQPAKLRVVEVAVGVQEVALGDGVDRDQPDARLRAERVVGGLALGRRELVAVDVAEAVRVGLLAGRVQRLVRRPVGEAALGVGRHDDRAARARQQRGEARRRRRRRAA